MRWRENKSLMSEQNLAFLNMSGYVAVRGILALILPLDVRPSHISGDTMVHVGLGMPKSNWRSDKQRARPCSSCR